MSGRTLKLLLAGGILPAVLLAGMLAARPAASEGPVADESPLADVTWDGGGTTNNWSEAANWSGNVVPTANDRVFFNATSAKNCTIDVNVTLSFLDIGAGYTGAISQGGSNLRVTGIYTQAGGTFNMGGGTFTLDNNFQQAGGVFNGGSGMIDLINLFSNLVLNGGTFNAPSGVLMNSGSIVFNGGVFNHNNGTVVFAGSGNSGINSTTGAAEFVFNNFTVSKTGADGRINIGTSPLPVIRILGALTLNSGAFGQGTFKAEGAVNVFPAFGNGCSFCGSTDNFGNLLIQDGSGARTITLPAGVGMPRITLNDPNVTLNTNGAGLISIHGLFVQNGVADFGATDVALRNNSSSQPALGYRQTGGVFTIGSGNIIINTDIFIFTLDNGTFTKQSGDLNFGGVNHFITINGGTFNAPGGTTSAARFNQTGGVFNSNGTLDINSTVFIAGGVFNAPAGNMFAHGFDHSGGAFNANGGTLIIDSIGLGGAQLFAPNGSTDTFNNLILDTDGTNIALFSGAAAGAGIVAGTFRVVNGTPLGALQVNGDVTIENGTDGLAVALTFGGNANQTFTNNGPAFGFNVIVNKTGGTVNLATDFVTSDSNTLFLTNGTITTGEHVVDVGGRNISRANGYINGNLRRTFTSAGTKVFDVGTANGYAPVSVNVTNLATNPSRLTVGSRQGVHPLLNPAGSLGRFWPISESGNLTATLTFNYLQTDVNGVEADYKVNRIANNQVEILNPPTAIVNINNNTATVTGVTDFSDWTLSSTLPPPPPLQLTPANPTSETGGTVNFVATGGAPPYTFSLPVNNSGGIVNASTGVYVAGATSGVTDTVRVTDSANTGVNTQVTVINPFHVVNTGSDGPGSLRRAIQNANAAPGPQTIIFNIPGNGPHTLNLTIPLPALTDAAVIDGATQPGFAGAPVIELNGAAAGPNTNGIHVQADNVTIKNLVINRFSNSGVSLGADGNIPANNCSLLGNYIGVGLDGLTARPNDEGIEIVGSNNTIGDLLGAQRNVISGNNGDGVTIRNSSANNRILSNFIGVGADGATPRGNTGNGVEIFPNTANFAGNNEIAANTIAHSGENGILVNNQLGTSAGNAFSLNRIFANAQMGIDLAPAGVTANDVCDADTGSNNLQNFPVITSVSQTGSGVVVAVALNSRPNRSYFIDLYANSSAEPNGHGEGQRPLGGRLVTTDASCNANFAQEFSLLQPGEFVTATARDTNSGDTSEFSAAVVVPAACGYTVTPTAQTFGSSIANGTVTVTTTAPTCEWTAQSNSSFTSIQSGFSGTGSGSVNYTVAPNLGGGRTGGLTVAGQTVTITQNGGRPVFFVINNNDSGLGSLRQAILDANTLAGADEIRFNLPANGSHTISPAAPLPEITETVTIDGLTQTAGTPVELSGLSLPGLPTGLTLLGGGSILRGLTINGFHTQISLAGSGGHIVEGNKIGTDVAGNNRVVRPNSNGVGITFTSDNNRIGGAGQSATRNIIGSGNGILHSAGSGNRIQGNFIGVNAAGNAGFGTLSGSVGILAFSAGVNNLIGGSQPQEGNVISGLGVGVRLDAANYLVEGNFIGTDAAGALAVPNIIGAQISSGVVNNNVISGNSFSGLTINNMGTVTNNKIGLSATRQPLPNNFGISVSTTSPINGANITGNEIAFNTSEGIKLVAGVGALFPRSSLIDSAIYANGRLGISLSPFPNANPLPNDPGDADFGNNSQQNYPVLTLAVSGGGNLNAQGSLNSVASSNYTLRFYSSAACDPSGFGEGETFVGQANVTTDAGGLVGFNQNFAANVPAGRFITATATDAQNNTSEFSQCLVVTALPVSVSGRLTDNNNRVMPNVQLELVGSSSARTLTDKNGDYSFANLPGGGNYTVRPLFTNFSFSPAQRIYTNLNANQTGQNFTGAKTGFTVSGRVASLQDGAQLPVGGATVALLNGLTQVAAVTTDNSGFYSFSNLMPGSYTVRPAKPNYDFSPASRSVSVSPADATADFAAQNLLAGLTGRIGFGGNNFSLVNANGENLVAVGPPAIGALSHDGKKLAYTKNVSADQREIFVADFDGGNEIRLTNNNFFDFHPNWSFDGAKIAFVREGQIFTMNANGSNQTPIALPFTANWAAWSPDGARLVVSGSTGIYVLNLGGGPAQIANSGIFPVWSPDGTKIAYRDGNAIKTMNPDGSNQTTVATGNFSATTVAWSPDSSRLVYDPVTPNGTGKSLIIVNANGSSPVTIAGGLNSAVLSWGATPSAATGAGANVSAQLGGVSVTFPNISAAGNTAVTPIPLAAAGTAPGGFVVGNVAYEITTTANFTPPVTVCLAVPTTMANTPTAFNQLALLHNEGGILVNRTTSRNFLARTICGVVNSLSPFALGEEVSASLPTISGLLVDAGNNPLSGVPVRLTGAENRSATTDSNGLFTFVNLTAGANYTVQPKQAGFLFTAYSRDVLNLTGDATLVFNGTPAVFQISGRVLNENGNGVSGVTVNLTGETEATVTTDAGGNYSIPNLPADGSYTVIPASPTVSFSPARATVAPLTANTAEVNFQVSAMPPPASTMQFSDAAYGANENGAQAVITVTRTGDTSVAAAVDFTTDDNFNNPEDCATQALTANQRCDYTPAQGTLIFAAGETTKTFTVPLTDDFYPENNETLGLTLSNPTGGALGANAAATLTIFSEDTTTPAPRLFVARLNGAEEAPPANSVARGFGTVALNEAETNITVNLSFNDLSSAQTAAHIHGPAPVGVNAPVLFNLGTGAITNQTFTVTAAQVAQLKAGLFYFNVHTQNFPNGEIRGQILPNPAESARFFVSQQYHDFLSRVPDQAGEDFWVGQIANVAGVDLNLIRQRRVAVSNAFFFELEYQQTGAYTYRLYRESFGNTQPFGNPNGDMDSHPYCQANPQNCQLIRASHVPSYQRFTADRASLNVSSLAATQLALAANFANRAEFIGRYPVSQTADQFVDALIANIQAASGANLTGQRTALINLYNNTTGGQTAQRGAVLFRLAEDNAAGNPINNRVFIDAEYNKAFVTTQYFGYLRRDADMPGLNFWLGVVNQFPLRSPVGQNGMVCAFITSAEYQQRFNPYFTRTNQTDCQ